ncbi:MAG: hypothetical protein ACREJ5_12460 [Geminicoccaceae bacterium]
MANVFERIDGFLGRLVFRAIGCVTALITLAALWAAFDSATPWEGSKSLAALLMFGAGAVIAGCVTRWCFSRERTFGDFIAAVEGDDTDNPIRERFSERPKQDHSSRLDPPAGMIPFRRFRRQDPPAPRPG